MIPPDVDVDADDDDVKPRSVRHTIHDPLIISQRVSFASLISATPRLPLLLSLRVMRAMAGARDMSLPIQNITTCTIHTRRHCRH